MPVPDAGDLTPQVSIVVPACIQSDEHLQQFHCCLSSLRHLSPPADEVLVVLDGDHAEARAIASEYANEVFALPQQSGPSAARNFGVRHAKGEILFFVDADCEAANDCIAIIRSTLSEQPEVAAVFGSYDDAPGAANFLSQYKNLMHHWTHQNSAENASTFWGACGAIRRDVFLHMGGFDEKYWFLEDVDLGYRLKRANYQIRLIKILRVKHLKRYTATSLVKSDFCHRALPWTHLLLREKHLRSDLNLDSKSRLSVVLVYLLMISASAAPRYRPARALALLCALGLLLLNFRVYRFLAAERGALFALRAVPWHWLYFAYGGLGFIVGSAQHACHEKS